MLEFAIDHQAVGLSTLGRTAATRLLTMVHHPGQSGEWRMLWSLCDALGGMGLSVAVLDGSAAESAHNPGLRQVLLHPTLLTTLVADGSPWTVLPSALGLQQIVALRGGGEHPAPALLGELFGHVDVVLLYAPTSLLVALVPEHDVHPLLTVSPDPASLLANYRSLKEIVLRTQMHPAVAAIESIAFQVNYRSTEHPLRRCAQAFLGCVPDWTTLSLAQHGAGDVGDDVVQLACRLLEVAPTLRHNGGVRKDH